MSAPASVLPESGGAAAKARDIPHARARSLSPTAYIYIYLYSGGPVHLHVLVHESLYSQKCLECLSRYGKGSRSKRWRQCVRYACLYGFGVHIPHAQLSRVQCDAAHLFGSIASTVAGADRRRRAGRRDSGRGRWRCPATRVPRTRFNPGHLGRPKHILPRVSSSLQVCGFDRHGPCALCSC